MDESQVSWGELIQWAQSILSSSIFDAYRACPYLVIDRKEESYGLARLVLGLCSGKDLLLGDSQGVSEACLKLGDKERALTSIARSELDLSQLFQGQRRIGFMTSGTSASAKVIWRENQGLWLEALYWQQRYQLTTQSRLLSWVSPFHIYGFIHSFMQAGLAACFVDFKQWENIEDLLWQEPPELLIAVPSLWSAFLRATEQGGAPQRLVMSGSSFGWQRQQELLALPLGPQEAWEILGSTETGGIGWRCLYQDDSGFWPLPEIQLKKRDQDAYLQSSFLAPESECLLKDQLRSNADGKLYHEGRSDRVFKYAGRRFALEDLEEVCRRLLPGRPLLCRFVEQAHLAQGGYLVLWVESELPIDRYELQKNYRQHTDAPFPHVLEVHSSLPRNRKGLLLPLSEVEGNHS